MIADIGSTGSSTPTLNPAPGGQLGKDEFLKMLVAQLKNQDPLNPMKGDDMAAQLAQFSSLEQLTNIGKALEAQASLQDGLVASINDTTAMNILGKKVLAVGDQVDVPGDGTGEVSFQVGGQGGLATLKILDQSGRTIGSRSLGFAGPGKHRVELGSAADGLAPGAYRYTVDVVDTAGSAVPSQPFISARIDSVRYGPEGPVLTSGDMEIPFGTIVQITNE